MKLPWEKSPYDNGPVEPVPDEAVVPGLVGAVLGVLLSALMVIGIIRLVASL